MTDKNKGRIQGFVFTILMLIVGLWLLADIKVGGILVNRSIDHALREARERKVKEQIEAGKQEYLKRYREIEEAKRQAREREH